jgi:hypothetical protein
MEAITLYIISQDVPFPWLDDGVNRTMILIADMGFESSS